MALIKLSSIGITNLSGKAGGSVFAHNKGGKYVRNFAVPSNPSTPKQQEVRGSFGGFAGAWRGLTQSQRDQWNSIAPDYPQVDRFGDAKSISGFNLFISLNQNLRNGDQSPIFAPLAPTGTAAPLGLAIQAVGLDTTTDTLDFGVLFTFDNMGAVVNDSIILEATAPVSAGVNNVKNKYRVIQVEEATTSPMSIRIEDAYIAAFGMPPIGGKIGVRAKFLNNDTGETSSYVSAIGIVADDTP